MQVLLNMVATVELEKIVSSKINAWHQILFIERMSIGVAQTPFKERFRNHNRDFNHEQYIKSKELSKYIWSLKDAGTPYTINWSIVAKVKGSTKINYCPLCLTEKYHLIEYFNDIRLLNKKSEFVNACRHQSKLLLKNLNRNESMD